MPDKNKYIEDFFTSSPKYRTKKRLMELFTAHEAEVRREIGERIKEYGVAAMISAEEAEMMQKGEVRELLNAKMAHAFSSKLLEEGLIDFEVKKEKSGMLIQGKLTVINPQALALIENKEV